MTELKVKLFAPLVSEKLGTEERLAQAEKDLIKHCKEWRAKSGRPSELALIVMKCLDQIRLFQAGVSIEEGERAVQAIIEEL